MKECPIINTRRLAIIAGKYRRAQKAAKERSKRIQIGARRNTRGDYKNDLLAWLKKRNTVTRESFEVMLSRLALADKGASDSETHESISFTACGVLKIVILISTSTACTQR